jgi:hypothetical protein
MTYAQVSNDKVVAIFSCDQDGRVWPSVVLLDDNNPGLTLTHWSNRRGYGGFSHESASGQ